MISIKRITECFFNFPLIPLLSDFQLNNLNIVITVFPLPFDPLQSILFTTITAVFLKRKPDEITFLQKFPTECN